MILRDYQKRALDDLYAWFEKNQERHHVLNMPGDSEKSFVIASMVSMRLLLCASGLLRYTHEDSCESGSLCQWG